MTKNLLNRCLGLLSLYVFCTSTAFALTWDTNNVTAQGTGCFLSANGGDIAVLANGNDVSVIFSNMDIQLNDPSQGLQLQKLCNMRIPFLMDVGSFEGDLDESVTIGIIKSVNADAQLDFRSRLQDSLRPGAARFNTLEQRFNRGSRVNQPLLVRQRRTPIGTDPENAPRARCAFTRTAANVNSPFFYESRLLLNATRQDVNQVVLLQADSLDVRLDLAQKLRPCTGAPESADSNLNQGRLSLVSGSAVPSGEVMSKTLYFTSHSGSRIALWNGSTWAANNFAETSLSFQGSSAGVYDIFVAKAGAGVSLESVKWGSNTARSQTLGQQNGKFVKSGDATRRYVGSVYFTGGTLVDSPSYRGVWNIDNRVIRPLVGQVADISYISENAVGMSVPAGAVILSGQPEAARSWVMGTSYNAQTNFVAKFIVGSSETGCTKSIPPGNSSVSMTCNYGIVAGLNHYRVSLFDGESTYFNGSFSTPSFSN